MSASKYLIELIPMSPIWRLYAYYVALGGAGYRSGDGAGVLLSRLCIFLPMRWLFVSANRTPAILWIAVVVWSVFEPWFAWRLALFLLGALLLNDCYRIFQYFRGES